MMKHGMKHKRSLIFIAILLSLCFVATINIGMSAIKINDSNSKNKPTQAKAFEKESSGVENISQIEASNYDVVSSKQEDTVTSQQSDETQQVTLSAKKEKITESSKPPAIPKKESKAPASSTAPSSSTPSSSTPPTSSTPITSLPPTFVHPAKLVVGYYGGWAAYSGHTPDKINVANIDILHYAFAKIGNDLKVAIGDSHIDLSNFNRLSTLKNANPHLKTVISIGGWTYSDKFSDAALTHASRTAFADSAVSFMKTHGFDGIDIDWEYPTGGGLATNVTRSVDKTNFALLMNTLRVKLNEQSIKDNRYYTLSFAGGANNTYASNAGLATIAKDVDYGIIMTYDLHGGWDTYTDFNAPLYIPSGQSPQYKTSVDTAVNLWLNNGFPASKLILGVPFYGYAYQGTTNANNGLWQRFGSATSIGFDTIKTNYLTNPSYQKHYHSSGMVPWLFNGSTFISYDDEASIQLKAQYALNKNLLGAGAWEVSHDKNGTLMQVIRSVLRR